AHLPAAHSDLQPRAIHRRLVAGRTTGRRIAGESPFAAEARRDRPAIEFAFVIAVDREDIIHGVLRQVGTWRQEPAGQAAIALGREGCGEAEAPDDRGEIFKLVASGLDAIAGADGAYRSDAKGRAHTGVGSDGKRHRTPHI